MSWDVSKSDGVELRARAALASESAESEKIASRGSGAGADWNRFRIGSRLFLHLANNGRRIETRRLGGVMRSDLRLLLVLAVASCGTGCAAAPDAIFDEAARSFGREYSCPDNRLQVEHAEVRLADLVESKQPPAEVAADAGRLAVWNQTVDKELASYEHLTAVDVAGCGSHATYFCWYGHRIHRNHECLPVDLDDPQPDFATLTLKPSARQQVRQRLGLPPAPPSPRPTAMAQPNEPQTSTAEITAAFRAREEAMRQRLAALAKETSETPPAPKPAPPPNR